VTDTSRLQAHLAFALAVGLTSCTDGDKPDAGVHVDLSKAGGRKANKPKVNEAVDPSGGEAVDGDDDGRASGGSELSPPPEVVALCSSGLVHKDKAIAERYGASEVDGCPDSIAPPPDTAGPARYVLLESNVRVIREAGHDDWCCYGIDYPERGRPLVDEGRARLPTFLVGPRCDAETPDAEAPMHRRIAAGWLHDARMEWASVAAFMRAREELRARGGPAWLLAAHDRAADDERRHAAMCLDLARRFAGRRLRLGPLPSAPPRALGLEALLRSTFVEGAVAETIAALVARRAGRHAAPEVAAILDRIADDETEHAALAWATIGWGWPRLPVEARPRFLRWARAQRPSPARVARNRDARFGRLARATERAIAADAWASCIEPLLAGLGTGPGADLGGAASVSINA
jgi:hypothetical protein